MRFLLISVLFLTGCETGPSADEVSTILINSLNSGKTKDIDHITGAAFLAERVQRCEFLKHVTGSDDSCENKVVLKEWDDFLVGVHEHMAPCEYRNLTKGTRNDAAAHIICSDVRDTFLLVKDNDGWRISGVFDDNMVELAKKVIVMEMVSLFGE